MSLALYYHPLASFCWKTLIALYENETPFEPRLVDLGDPASSTEFKKLWPIGKFPVLRDDARDRTIPESSIIIEYLTRHYPGPTKLLPDDPDLARQTRLADRFYDLYVHEPMQKIVTGQVAPGGTSRSVRRRPSRKTAADQLRHDRPRHGREDLDHRRRVHDGRLAASPALFYANTAMPFEAGQKNLAGYLDRLMARPSFARVLNEAEPYFANFPMDRKPRIGLRAAPEVRDSEQ